jgi:hypothetical protein
MNNVPHCFRIQWTGRDLCDSDDWTSYELSPDCISTNKVCVKCKREFFLTYDCNNLNRFAEKFNMDAEPTMMLWQPCCTMCVAHAVGDFNLQWQELNAWKLTWNDTFEWDIILKVICNGLLNHHSRPVLLQFVALKVFGFLAMIGEFCPAQLFQQPPKTQLSLPKKKKRTLDSFFVPCTTPFVNQRVKSQAELLRAAEKKRQDAQRDAERKRREQKQQQRQVLMHLLQTANTNILWVKDLIASYKERLFAPPYGMLFSVQIGQTHETAFEKSNYALVESVRCQFVGSDPKMLSCKKQKRLQHTVSVYVCRDVKTQPRNTILELLLLHLLGLPVQINGPGVIVFYDIVNHELMPYVVAVRHFLRCAKSLNLKMLHQKQCFSNQMSLL